MNLSSLYDVSGHADAPAAGSPESRASAQQANDDANKTAAKNAETKAATVFDTMPQGEKKAPEATKVEKDPAAALFDKQFDHALPFATDTRGVEAEAVETINTAARESYTALELPVPVAETLTTKFVDAGNRFGTPQEMTDEQHAAARTKMHAELTQRFGAEGFKERLAEVRTLLARAPQLGDLLVDFGLDVDADVITALADHARSLKGRGRLA